MLADGGGLGWCHGGQCSDLQNDPNNCGAPGVRCPSGLRCVTGICDDLDCADGGRCPSGYSCQPSWGCVPVDCTVGMDDDYCANSGDPNALSFCCAGACIGDSAANCGGCNVTCPATTACLDSRCVPVNACGPGAPFIAHQYLTCLLPSGDAGQCCGADCTYTPQRDPCFTIDCTLATEGAGCPRPGTADGICCGGACVDYENNGAHCGGCGISCDAGQSCLNRSCIELAPPSTSNDQLCRIDDGGLGYTCSGKCTDAFTDPVNCGGCSIGCPNGDSCDGGVCLDHAGALDYCTVDSDCPAGTLCNGNLYGCSPPTCGSGNAVCSGGDGGGWYCCGTTCADTLNDPENCGGCALTCPPIPGVTCSNGQCQLPDGGVEYCFGDGGCPAGFQCVGTGCLPLTCELGQIFCYLPGSPAYNGMCCDGVCVDTSTDPLNCFACGIECPSGHCDTSTGCTPLLLEQGCAASCGPGAICALGQCVDSRCYAPSAYCLAADGAVGTCCLPQGYPYYDFACADLTNDPQNCGACNAGCDVGQICDAGRCATP